ncbi:MAG: hypothetical protein LBE22_10070 [Azoarcus sp.]|nr:hypothetical protein [Azoarcus sp.]
MHLIGFFAYAEFIGKHAKTAPKANIATEAAPHDGFACFFIGLQKTQDIRQKHAGMTEWESARGEKNMIYRCNRPTPTYWKFQWCVWGAMAFCALLFVNDLNLSARANPDCVVYVICSTLLKDPYFVSHGRGFCDRTDPTAATWAVSFIHVGKDGLIDADRLFYCIIVAPHRFFCIRRTHRQACQDRSQGQYCNRSRGPRWFRLFFHF